LVNSYGNRIGRDGKLKHSPNSKFDGLCMVQYGYTFDDKILARVIELIHVHKCPPKMAIQEVANITDRSFIQVQNLFESYEELKIC